MSQLQSDKSREVRKDTDTGNSQVSGLSSEFKLKGIVGPEKRNSIEEALKIRNTSLESNGVSITVVKNSPATPEENGNCPPVTITPVPVPITQSVPAPTSSVNQGNAKCESCGTVGIKDAFYTKQRNYCSAACVKAGQKKTDEKDGSTMKEKESRERDSSRSLPDPDEDSTSSSALDSRPSSAASMATGAKLKKKGKAKLTAAQVPVEPPTYEWTPILDNHDFEAAPVTCFKHVPWSQLWENITLGMKVEVENKDVNHNNFAVAFWVASVIKIQGYKVKLRFEGYGTDPTSDFWVNLCSPDVHHVGWCATKGKPLIPPNQITNRHRDWRDFLVKRLTGARTLPQNFQMKVDGQLKSRYPNGTKLEIVDKMRISQLRLAEVRGCVGKRLNLVYFDSADNEGFWCHEDSSLIHQCGWARSVGQELSAPPDYKPDFLPSSTFKVADDYSNIQLKEGMKLEAVDPLNLSVICAATIKKVLKFGYVMVRVDCYEDDPTCSDWFCYHMTSSSIFPCGFCSSNNIPLVPPYKYEGSFDWAEYFVKTGAKPAPLQQLNKSSYKSPLRVGMRLEAADLMDPRLVCVATVARVIGPLLKIHFDGWEEEYDQWLDARSPDIYPVGWCEIVKHRLEFPPQPVAPKKAPKKTKGGAGKKKRHLRVDKANNDDDDNDEPKKRPKLLDDLRLANVGENLKRYSQGAEKSNLSPSNQKSTVHEKNGELSQNRKVTTANCIPKLSDGEKLSQTTVDPERWSKEEVSQFLLRNDSVAYVESFMKNNIDGPRLLNLTKDEIIGLTGMKVGPGVKIWDMIQQLKRFVNTSNRKSALTK